MAPSKRTSSTDMVLLRTLIPRRNGITSHVLEASRAACAAHRVIAACPSADAPRRESAARTNVAVGASAPVSSTIFLRYRSSCYRRALAACGDEDGDCWAHLCCSVS